MNEKRSLKDLSINCLGAEAIKLENCGINTVLSTGSKYRVNIIALGDVGTNVLMGLKLLGGDIIDEIGIYDLNEPQLARLEMEFNQMAYPPKEEAKMPKVKILSGDDLFDCDVLIFCATKGIPEIGASGDVRMMQLEANLSLVKDIGGRIKKYNEEHVSDNRFTGLVCVVSDPVDQLCMGMLESSGLSPGQIRGYGLGVMAARAKYYAERDDRFSSFISEGRAFGPHGKDLIIANSIENYDEDLSIELTKLAVEANLRVRDLGFKPYLAPAISSAAISIILTLRGKWNYGSLYIGGEDRRGAYIGVLSRVTPSGVEYEDVDLPEKLYKRIERAYKNLLE